MKIQTELVGLQPFNPGYLRNLYRTQLDQHARKMVTEFDVDMTNIAYPTINARVQKAAHYKIEPGRFPADYATD